MPLLPFSRAWRCLRLTVQTIDVSDKKVEKPWIIPDLIVTADTCHTYEQYRRLKRSKGARENTNL